MKSYVQVLTFGFKNFKGQSNPQFKNINLRKDYYKILEISPDASMIKIRKNYLKLAKCLHPDINPKGHAQFTQIQQAYNVLGDGQLKKYYDNNNIFSQSFQKTHNSEQDLNERNRDFYDYMKSKGYENFNEESYQKEQRQTQNSKPQEQQEDSETAKKRKKIEDQIKLARKILFSRNPVWDRANAMMNYQAREEREKQKQKELEALFPKSSKVLFSFIRWVEKH